MTVKRNTMNDDKWASEYMAAETRRNRAYGAAIVAAVVLLTAIILYFFASTAAMPW